jgi:hypothetical protein
MKRPWATLSILGGAKVQLTAADCELIADALQNDSEYTYSQKRHANRLSVVFKLLYAALEGLYEGTRNARN